MPSATLAELAARFDCRLGGRGDVVIERVATLRHADGHAIAFLANPLYRDDLATTAAGAVILKEAFVGESPAPCLISDNPYAAFARMAAYLHPEAPVRPGVHPTAVIAADAVVASSAHVGAHTVVGSACRIGAGAVLGAGCVLGNGVVVGDHTRLSARVTVLDGVTIGQRCIVHSGAVLGADGFGFAEDAGTWVKVPQLGGVILGNDVEVGANTTIDRGTIEATVIEDGVKLDNLIQVAHNVRLGAHTVMAAMSGVAGSTRVGRRCRIGGGVVIANQLVICDDVALLFRSVVTRSIETPGVYGGTFAADEAGKWRRNAARFRNLDTMAQRLRALERAVKPDQAEETES
jgi:UDP-3-O-[3-hydroxymyristoyl] glucosamine N-acyltransferase